VGKRKLEAAMEQVQDKYEFRVSWEPFLLRPAMPKDGIEKPAEYKAASGHLKSSGEAVGIDFTGKCPRFPYTVTAHVLMDYAKSVDDTFVKQNQLAEVIFQGYFTDGVYPDEKNLLKMAAQVGLDETAAKAAMRDSSKAQEVTQTALSWSEKGISGVPYFIMNGQKVFSGAQDAASIVHMFEVITERFPLASRSGAQASM
jgi:predicted DsbA family dithiol-disulfide isomerase